MKRALVLDLGSYSIKAGFSSSQCPQYIIPNVLGRDEVNSKIFFCDKVISNDYDLTITNPLERTNILNWKDQCLVLDYIFQKKLKISPSDFKLMITESPLVSRKQRKHLIEVLFEQYSIPSLYILPESLSALCGANLSSGTVVEIGQNCTRIASVVDFKIAPKSCAEVKVGGGDITQRLSKLLQYRKLKLPEIQVDSQIQKKMFLNQFKENYCHVSKNIIRTRMQSETNASPFVTYTAKDGSTIKMQGEMFEPSEVLFDPSLVGMEGLGLIPTLFANFAKITNDDSIRKQITKNVILSGGTALMTGLEERITNDIKQLFISEISGQNKYNLNENLIPNIETLPNSNVLTFSGASITAHNYLPRNEYWANSADYRNEGSDAIVRRFKTSTLRQ